jgi:peptidoglycan/xylan/chitin deacetylase (PgdA/CDA1 family)
MSALILCYHKVGPVGEEGRSLNVEPRLLDSHVRFFKRRRCPFLTASRFSDRPFEDGVCLTFDDAYASTVSNGLDVLNRHGVKGTLYVVSDRAGKTSDWDAPTDRRLASVEDLRAAAKEGHEIGNHTKTHCRLDAVDDARLREEISGAHSQLCKEGLRPLTICYPYGAHDHRAVSEARLAGYEVGMSLLKGPVGTASDPMRLPRFVIAFSDSLPLLIYKTFVKPALRL